jgi:CheY-like chemotaxis protein
MSDSKIKKQLANKLKSISDVSVLIIDDEEKVIKSIRTEADLRGYTRFRYATKVNQAIRLAEEINFDIISTDYTMPGQQIDNELADGIGLLKYMLTDPDRTSNPKGCIVYTAVESGSINIENYTWCKQVGIAIINKSISGKHETFFKAIESLIDKSSLLPENPKYAFMKENDLLIDLASDLLEELEANKNDSFSFGSDHLPMKNSDVINEIKSLSPLGKEVLGNWFGGIKMNLDFLHNEHIKSKKK